MNRVIQPEDLIKKYQDKGVLLDTNLLLLFLAGINDSVIGKFKPVENQGFTEADFKMLQRVVGKFKKCYTTPHILTEVSNHADKLKGDAKLALSRRMAEWIHRTEEHWEASANLCKRNEFPRLGLTDTAISDLAPGRCLVLTTDYELAGLLSKKGVDVVNLSNLRGIRFKAEELL